MAPTSPSLVAAAWLLAAALGGCSRASSPPPAPEPAGSPSPPAVSAAVTPEVDPAPASPSSTAVASPAVSASTASAEPAPTDCSKQEGSADPRARATCEAKEEFRAFVSSHQSCSSAADCTIVTGSCPFGCFVPVTKASREETLAKLGSLGERLDKAGHRCVYRCMSPPTEACVQGRCSAAPR
jgi:hypothetical protein